ncbi:hypothetical protein [Virgisporangium ochraceum]|uniref:hypothetical protein n=1 Tax=Virgisporangium ochraceum TaxID=65505 RepID=UPI001944600E|nr:hypothetical protein [Virgisporangium ochraceum]
MNQALRDLLRASGGIIHHADALAVVPGHVLRWALRSRRLRQVLPLVYVDADLAVDSDVVAAAALRYAAGRAALSHTSALRVWRLPVPLHGPLHLTVAAPVRLRGSPEVRVHRRNGFELVPPQVVVRGGYPVTRLETSIIEAWPLLDRDAQRAPAIRAVAERLTTPGRLSAALEDHPRLAGRRVLTGLLGKLAVGCRSELEIWGYDQVFRTIPGLCWQHPVSL